MLGLLSGFTDCSVIDCSGYRLSNHRKETHAYRERCVFQAAAKIWVEGVPWEEAMDMSRKALAKSDPPPKGKGKAKGKGKGKRRVK